MGNPRFRIEIFRNERTSWLDWREQREVEYAKTKGELEVLVACILEDASIVRSFHEDMTNGRITHIKANGKPVLS